MAWAELPEGEFPKRVCEQCRTVYESVDHKVPIEYFKCTMCWRDG